MEYITTTLGNLVQQTAFFSLTGGNLIMIAVACFFLYLAIRHEFEPLLLVPIAFGMLLVNIFPDIMLHAEDAANGTGGLLYYFYLLDESLDEISAADEIKIVNRLRDLNPDSIIILISHRKNIQLEGGCLCLWKNDKKTL